MERLTKCVGIVNGKPIYTSNIDMRKKESVDKLINALGKYEDLEEQGLPEKEWIPSEEPPVNDDYILLSFANFSIPLVGHYEKNKEGGAFYIGDDEESCISQNFIVNGWMPLPKRYEG